ncbi:MAG TPA: F0F1 ATP synthase subunit delta [Candidatus Sulfotelmatobacter sp.]|jgi:F0F1-type ATP synthase delta subunit|nr:F0F1 ATP synthase subunit delta [Candidatus Sulfotelmatobacter sp.]
MGNLDLSEFFTTKTEANIFLSRITTISEMAFQTNFNLEKALQEQLGINKSDRLLVLMQNNNINTESLSAVKDFFRLLSEKLTMLPMLTLTIAFEPQVQTLKALSEWCLVNLHKQMLFEITVDTSLVGGALISNNGKFFDFSIRPTVTRILKKELSKPATNLSQQNKPVENYQNINDITIGR